MGGREGGGGGGGGGALFCVFEVSVKRIQMKVLNDL